MVNYRRNFVPGGTYFFTVNLHNRQSQQLTQAIDLLRQAFRYTRHKKPFHIVAIVVLPDHLHTIWSLPPDDADYSGRWKMIKAHFSQHLRKSGFPVEKRQDNSTLLWQRRFWEHTIRDDEDLQRHIDYIHYNPVKHGLTTRWSIIPILPFIVMLNKVFIKQTGQVLTSNENVLRFGDA